MARAGATVRDERRRRAWTMRELAGRARVSPATVVGVEAGRAASVEVYARLAFALGLEFDIRIGGPERAIEVRQKSDLVHAAMGEFLTRRLERFGYNLSIDHPYQHFQFAGRADIVAWDVKSLALLHIENRTRFPELHEAAGSFQAKCRYLARVLAEQVGLPRFASQTHVMAGLWSSEVLRTIRSRPSTFRALCPDDGSRLAEWLSGRPPGGGFSRSFVLLDPLAKGRATSMVDLDTATGGARPRVRGYPEAAERLRQAGQG